MEKASMAEHMRIGDTEFKSNNIGIRNNSAYG